jgi:hypothetical protein
MAATVTTGSSRLPGRDHALGDAGVFCFTKCNRRTDLSLKGDMLVLVSQTGNFASLRGWVAIPTMQAFSCQTQKPDNHFTPVHYHLQSV